MLDAIQRLKIQDYTKKPSLTWLLLLAYRVEPNPVVHSMQLYCMKQKFREVSSCHAAAIARVLLIGNEDILSTTILSEHSGKV